MDVLFVSIPVADLQTAMGWYRQLFGRPADIVPNEDEAMWNITGRGWVYVIKDLERAGRTGVTISVNDLDQFVADLASRGILSGSIDAVGDAGRKANVGIETEMSSAGFRSPWTRSTDAPTAGGPVENMHHMRQVRPEIQEAGAFAAVRE